MATALGGRLVRASTREPLQGVTVAVINAADSTVTTTVTTDAQGVYSATGLAAATYYAAPRITGTDWELQPDITGAGLTFATPGIVLGAAAAAGSATTPIRSDATIAAFDATVPTTLGLDTAAAVGTAAFAARRDHAHGMFGSAAPTITLSTAAALGAASTGIRSDAVIAAFDATVPTTSAVGDAAATGSVAFTARRDHGHGREAFATPTGAVAESAAPGVAATVNRSDHVHPHGSSYLPDAHHSRSHDHSNALDDISLAFTSNDFPSTPAVLRLEPSGNALQIANVTTGTAQWAVNDSGTQNIRGRLEFKNATAFYMALTGTPTANRVFTFPDVADDTVVLLAATQILTNKTLTAPVIGDFTSATHGHSSSATGGSALTPASLNISNAASRVITVDHNFNTTLNAQQLFIDQGGTGDAKIGFEITGVTGWDIGIDNSDGDNFKIVNTSGVGDFTATGLIINTSGSLLIPAAQALYVAGTAIITLLSGRTNLYDQTSLALNDAFTASFDPTGHGVANGSYWRAFA